MVNDHVTFMNLDNIFTKNGPDLKHSGQTDYQTPFSVKNIA